MDSEKDTLRNVASILANYCALWDVDLISVSAVSGEDGILISGMALDGDSVITRFNEYEGEAS